MMRASFRIPLQLLAILFYLGIGLLLFFIILAGSKTDGNVLNRWYWLAADTSEIPHAEYPISRWSMYGICGYEKGSNVKHPGNFIGCTSNKADFPFDPKGNFNLSRELLSDQFDKFDTKKFYYETRFQFPFYLIALFFDVVGCVTAIFSPCSRIVGIIASAFTVLTALFSILAAALSTAAYVNGRSVFKSADVEAAIAPTLYGFAWAVVFMAIVNVILLCVVTLSKKDTIYGSSGFSGFKQSNNASSYSTRKGGYRFGFKKIKTTVVPDLKEDGKDSSSFVRG